MTIDEAVEQFKKGSKILLCEYRNGKAETISYRDKKTGLPASFTQVKHSIEIGSDSFLVMERVPDNFDKNTWTAPCLKGAQSVVSFDRFMVEKGVGQFSGTIQSLSQSRAANKA